MIKTISARTIGDVTEYNMYGNEEEMFGKHLHLETAGSSACSSIHCPQSDENYTQHAMCRPSMNVQSTDDIVSYIRVWEASNQSVTKCMRRFRTDPPKDALVEKDMGAIINIDR